MTGLLDNETIEFACPHCRRKVSQTIGKLKMNPKLTCHCGQVFAANPNELRAAIHSSEQALAQLQRTLGRLNK